jgi:hypothetical protein
MGSEFAKSAGLATRVPIGWPTTGFRQL